MKTLRTMGLATGLVAAALVGGTLINAASASPTTTDSNPGLTAEMETGEYCELWRRALADELGVSVDALTPAGKVAAIATVDAAAANGDLPEDVAERMKARIEAADGDGCRLLGAGFHAFGKHAVRADWAHDWVTVAAETLGLEPADLITELREGQTLQDVAEAQGVAYEDLSRAILDATAEDLAELVEAGRVTQERADEMLANLAERLEAGEFPPMRGRGGPGGHGPRGGFGNGDGPFSG